MEKQIKILVNKYRTELKDAYDELLQCDRDYAEGYYNGKGVILEWVIRDLEKLLNE